MVSITYGTDGRMATASFLQGSSPKTFAWQYLTGSYLPAVMTMPNSMSLEWGYEEHRDLVTSMTYKRGTTVVAARGYTYDNLGRPITRQTARQGSTVNDSFTYNSRSELTAAMVNGKAYGYSYDNIGNRKTAQEDAEEATAYTANQLNQYTAIRQGDGEEETFIPAYDADGNQTRIKTSTGIWNVTYNAENRPVRFESADGATVIDCTYDYMGRRHTRKVTVNGTVSNYLRYIYRGYLQIAAIDAVSGVFRWFLFWDPTQPTATRPLAIRKDGTWYAYGWDLTKNVTEVFGPAGYIRTTYTYTPYGEATATGDVTQPVTWSSEYTDEELGLIYYNYRHLNPHDGRWISRDPEDESYIFTNNMPVWKNDVLGLYPDIFKGFENDRYQQHDKLIEELVNDFNKHKKEYAGCTEEQANSIPDLDENILKSMMIQETGGGDKRSRAAWNVDPLQVNVPRDFGEEKKCLGLKKPKKRNEGSLKGNLKAGIMYLVRKGFGRSGKAPCDTATFDGWKDAIRRYNGRTDLKNGKKYSEIYVKKIFKRAENPKIHEKIDTD